MWNQCVWSSRAAPRYCFLYEREIQILSFPPEEVRGFGDVTQRPLTLSIQTFCLDLSDAKVSQPLSRCETVEERKSPCICWHWAKVQQTAQRVLTPVTCQEWYKDDGNHTSQDAFSSYYFEWEHRLYWGECRVSPQSRELWNQNSFHISYIHWRIRWGQK